MEVSLQIIEQHARPILENLFQFYMYDLHAQAGLSLADDGRYTYDFSKQDVYWFSPQHTPYFIRRKDAIVGFALLRHLDECHCFDMEQFFVLQPYRRSGVGQTAFQQLTSRHAGAWQIRVLLQSHAALQFWLLAVQNVAKAGCTLNQENDHGRVMHFIRFETR